MPSLPLRGRCIVIAGTLFWSLANTACLSTPGYVVTLHDGRIYRSAQAPVKNPKTGYYKVRDHHGQDVLLRDREVASVARDPTI